MIETLLDECARLGVFVAYLQQGPERDWSAQLTAPPGSPLWPRISYGAGDTMAEALDMALTRIRQALYHKECEEFV